MLLSDFHSPPPPPEKRSFPTYMCHNPQNKILIFLKKVMAVQLILILWKLIVWKKSLVWKIFQLTKLSST